MMLIDNSRTVNLQAITFCDRPLHNRLMTEKHNIGPNSPIAGRIRLIRWVVTRDDQQHFAKILGITSTELNQYENGVRTPSKRALEKLERLCGVTQGYLIRDEKDKLTGVFGQAISMHQGPYPPPLRPRKAGQVEPPAPPSMARKTPRTRGKGMTEQE